jgi:hypothetical protein
MSAGDLRLLALRFISFSVFARVLHSDPVNRATMAEKPRFLPKLF